MKLKQLHKKLIKKYKLFKLIYQIHNQIFKK